MCCTIKVQIKQLSLGNTSHHTPAIHILYYEEEIDEEGKQQKAGHYNLLKRVTSLTQGTSDAVVSSVGDYVAVRLGKSTLYMAIITEDDNETKEVKVKFMEKSGTLFAFSDEEEKWVSVSTIIHKCSVPCMDTPMRYSFNAIDIRHIHEKIKLKMKLRKYTCFCTMALTYQWWMIIEVFSG